MPWPDHVSVEFCLKDVPFSSWLVGGTADPRRPASPPVLPGDGRGRPGRVRRWNRPSCAGIFSRPMVLAERL